MLQRSLRVRYLADYVTDTLQRFAYCVSVDAIVVNKKESHELSLSHCGQRYWQGNLSAIIFRSSGIRKMQRELIDADDGHLAKKQRLRRSACPVEVAEVSQVPGFSQADRDDFSVCSEERDPIP